MERKGGCCLAPRYGPASACQTRNIMLKFRPIAPKPAAMAPAPMAPSAPVTPSAGTAGKRKRKAGAVAVAGGGGKIGRKPKKAATPTRKVVDVRKERRDKPLLSSPSLSSPSGTTSVEDSSTPPPPPATLTPRAPPSSPGFSSAVDLAPAAPQLAFRPVLSCVTVESVTGTWRDGEAPPSAAAAAYGGDDEAPAFVSDRWGRVTWMNLAFNRAVSGGGGDAATVVPTAAASSDAGGVVLAAKDGAAVPAWGACAGFTCRVRVTYDACLRHGSLVAPCDVWRLDAGGYLWRLDLQATLTLSLGGLL